MKKALSKNNDKKYCSDTWNTNGNVDCLFVYCTMIFSFYFDDPQREDCYVTRGNFFLKCFVPSSCHRI